MARSARTPPSLNDHQQKNATVAEEKSSATVAFFVNSYLLGTKKELTKRPVPHTYTTYQIYLIHLLYAFLSSCEAKKFKISRIFILDLHEIFFI